MQAPFDNMHKDPRRNTDRTDPRWASHEEAKNSAEEEFIQSSNLQQQQQHQKEKASFSSSLNVKDSPSIRPMFSNAYTPYAGAHRDYDVKSGTGVQALTKRDQETHHRSRIDTER